MKKLFLSILVICSLFNGNAYAKDLLLYCKQEVRVITTNGVRKTIPMPENWEIKITRNQIHVLGYESLYPAIMRIKEKESETLYYGEDGYIVMSNVIRIDRVTGEGRMDLISGNTIARDIIKCSNKKPKLLF